MKHLIAASLALAVLTAAAPASFAVDNSISPLCHAENAGTGYQRPGGFCDIIKAYHKTPTGDGNKQQIENPCEAGYIPETYGPLVCVESGIVDGDPA